MKKIHASIWLDFKDAYIISTINEGAATVKHIHSDVRHPATKGGSHSKSPWGPQLSPSDNKDVEREKHAEHHYFQQILEHISPNMDDLVIFGPAQAKVGLKKEIERQKNYHSTLLAVLPANYLTQNEIVGVHCKSSLSSLKSV